jgi:hypothetical protein
LVPRFVRDSVLGESRGESVARASVFALPVCACLHCASLGAWQSRFFRARAVREPPIDINNSGKGQKLGGWR